MTLQLGLVASDGIVLSSDRLFQEYNGTGERAVSLGSKFLHAPLISCCFSGDKASEYAANYVRDADWSAVQPDDIEAIRSELKSCGDRGWKQWERQVGTVCQANRKVIASCHHTSLWLLDVGETSVANICRDRVIAGDGPNTARHFVNKYGEGCQNSPLECLISLAAYTILAGGDENPRGVGGLEIVVIPKGGPAQTLNADQERELSNSVVALVSEIRERLLTAYRL